MRPKASEILATAFMILLVCLVGYAYVKYGRSEPATEAKAKESTKPVSQKGKHEGPVVPASSGAKIKIPEKKFDFGDISPDETVSHVFTIHSVGTEPLQILGLKLSCSSCSKAKVSRETIPPGETAELTFTFDPHAYAGSEVSRSVDVTSNDENEKVVQLSIHGRIQEEFSLDPKVLSLGTIEPGEEVKKSVKIVCNKADLDLQLSDLKVTEAKRLSATVEPFEENGTKGYRIDIVFKSDEGGSFLQDGITLKTNVARVPKINIPVRAVVASKKASQEELGPLPQPTP